MYCIGYYSHRLSKKTIEILENFDPKKDYKVHIRKQISKVLSKLEKDKRYQLFDLIQKYDGVVTKTKNLSTTQDVFKQVMNVGKQIGVIKEVDNHSISFDNFCKLDTVSYMREQLTQTKYKNREARTKHSGGGTRRSYTLHLWQFNEWIKGKSIVTQMAITVGDNLQRIERKTIHLDSVEDLLHAFQESNNRGAEFERFIKSYLMDSTLHANKSKGYMGNIMSAIKSYFAKNESPIIINFNINVKHDDVSESIIEHVSTLSIPELYKLLKKSSITEEAVVLCKFHAGIDNSTFADRFNFESYMQLVRWFGTDKHEDWDLRKCPVIINLTRIKVGFPHISCLDQDAIKAMQKALDWRYKHTGQPMKVGQALFLNTKLRPITDRWISDLIPKLAERSGVQKKFQTKINMKNEKTSHELRDLLKSTLRKCGVPAYASDHLIGHMPRDSYEKESILYPNKIREEFMKASKDLNIFTGFTNYVKNGDDSDKLRKEIVILKDQTNSLENIQKTADNDHEVVLGLVKEVRGKDERQMELIQMISDLRNEVSKLKKKK